MNEIAIKTELGQLVIEASESGITRVEFDEKDAPFNSTNSMLISAADQLTRYFAGDLRQFDLPLDAAGTEFQQSVWQRLCNIPYGETCSYQDIADQIGNPKAVRAVGMTNGKNPIAIVVPCHRVIGKNGKLTGYAGGLDRKQKLLALEAEGPLI